MPVPKISLFSFICNHIYENFCIFVISSSRRIDLYIGSPQMLRIQIFRFSRFQFFGFLSIFTKSFYPKLKPIIDSWSARQDKSIYILDVLKSKEIEKVKIFELVFIDFWPKLSFLGVIGGHFGVTLKKNYAKMISTLLCI